MMMSVIGVSIRPFSSSLGRVLTSYSKQISGLRLQFEFWFLGMAKFIDLQNCGDQRCCSNSSSLDISISYLIEIGGFILRLGSVPLVIATEL